MTAKRAENINRRKDAVGMIKQLQLHTKSPLSIPSSIIERFNSILAVFYVREWGKKALNMVSSLASY